MRARLSALVIVALSFGTLFTSACSSSEKSCAIGTLNCVCTLGGSCDPGLSCVAQKCVAGAGTGGTSGATGGVSGNDGGTDAMSMSTDPETICSSITATCNKLNECAPLYVQLIFGTVDNCVTRYKLSCKDAVLAPSSGLTQAAASACAAALGTATCDAAIYRLVDACNFKGTRANGQACGADAQCTSGHCALTDSACGVCAGQAGAGQNCQEDDDCTPGLVCSADSHCVSLSGGGTACSETQPCRYGFYCRNNSCIATSSSAGQNCQDAGSCEFARGLVCNTALQTCAKIGNAGPGETCGWLTATSFVACAAGACRFAASGDSQGICTSLAKDGEPCGAATTNNVDCQFPARCLGGRCKISSSTACQ